MAASDPITLGVGTPSTLATFVLVGLAPAGAAVTGTGAVTTAPASLSATGALTFTGTASVTTAPASLAATGALTFTGTASVTTAPAALAATGTVDAVAPTATGGWTRELLEHPMWGRRARAVDAARAVWVTRPRVTARAVARPAVDIPADEPPPVAPPTRTVAAQAVWLSASPHVWAVAACDPTAQLRQDDDDLAALLVMLTTL
jgi:hypothetical protein